MTGCWTEPASHYFAVRDDLTRLLLRTPVNDDAPSVGTGYPTKPVGSAKRREGRQHFIAEGASSSSTRSPAESQRVLE